MKQTRRAFFGSAGWLTASGLGLPLVSWANEEKEAKAKQTPKNIIHLVSDGTSMGTICCADQFSRLIRGRGLAWLDINHRRDASLAMMNMRSLNSLVTDSAAASTSWGSGSRVVNGAVNCLPNGQLLTPLYALLGDQGWARGLVTTTEITHATPAGFASSIPKRDDAESIASQYLERKIEVLLGGGSKFFDAKTRKDKRDLYQVATQRGFSILRTVQELNAAPADTRWLGVFAPSHLPYTLDQQTNASKWAAIPTLARMTQCALQKLRRNSRFILQVEGGRVDHGAHNCDAAAAFRDLIAFDEALEVCLLFQREEPDTLIVVTVDHGTGTPALSGMGTDYQSSVTLFANLATVKSSFEVINGRIGKNYVPAALQSVLEDATGYVVPLAKAEMMARFLEKKGQTMFDLTNTVSMQLGQLMANYLGIGWVSGSHSSDYVPLVALGPGSEWFRGFLDNTDVFRHYLTLSGIDFRNPALPLMAECGPSAESVENGPAGQHGESTEIA